MNNTRSATICLWFTLTFFAAFMVFVMKNCVEDLEKELVQINSSINDDVKSIHILKAEWSHLNNPERLRKLAAKHIALEPVKPEQIINYVVSKVEHFTEFRVKKEHLQEKYDHKLNELYAEYMKE